MAIEIFNRHEGKYLLNKTLYEKIHNRLLDFMEIDEHNENDEFYIISNIYYDTKDNHLIRTSLLGPKYKEKLRLRAYGIPEENEKVYLEIKKKVSGLVNKRRTTLKLYEAYEFTRTGIKPEYKKYMNKQVLNEIEYFLKIYKLEPKLYLAYDRKALFGKENPDLRITFDKNIRTRRYDLKLENGDYGEKILGSDDILMEVKAEKNIPLWLSKMLSEEKIFKRKFSKYGSEYKRLLEKERREKGEIDICLKQYLTQYQIQAQLVQQYQ